jgi:hypothetical protein
VRRRVEQRGVVNGTAAPLLRRSLVLLAFRSCTRHPLKLVGQLTEAMDSWLLQLETTRLQPGFAPRFI